MDDTDKFKDFTGLDDRETEVTLALFGGNMEHVMDEYFQNPEIFKLSEEERRSIIHNPPRPAEPEPQSAPEPMPQSAPEPMPRPEPEPQPVPNRIILNPRWTGMWDGQCIEQFIDILHSQPFEGIVLNGPDTGLIADHQMAFNVADYFRYKVADFSHAHPPLSSLMMMKIKG